MDKNVKRNYILERLKSKITSQEEFNFDNLKAPPLNMFLSSYDIAELNYIIRSIRLSSKPKEKYQAIDNLCRRRGLVKFAAGTNRVVYRHPEFPDILFKIASDDIGLKDNPAEYRNQILLKPFVCKCFEISPCGTVGLFEKVNPITSREEFISVYNDIFNLINEWLIGKYVMADIGSLFFMNYGIRNNFGPVLLDYPYLYELDGNKLYCNKMDPLSKSGRCDGIIDYDDGYNFLVCTKCGAKYKAKELEKKIKDKEIINNSLEGIKMQITIRRGNEVIKESGVITDNCKEFKETITNTSTAPVVNASKAVNGVPEVKKINVQIKKPEVKEVEKKVEVKKVEEKKPEVKEAKSVVTFSEEYKEEALKEKENKTNTKTPGDIIEESITNLIKAVKEIEFDSVRNNVVHRLLDTVFQISSENLSNPEYFNKLINEVEKVMDNSEDQDIIDIFKNEKAFDVFRAMYSVDAEITEAKVEGDNLKYNVNINFSRFEDENADDQSVFYSKSYNKEFKGLVNIDIDTPSEIINTEDNNEEDSRYESFTFYKAKIISSRDLFPLIVPEDIIVIEDSEGGYITCKDDPTSILAIDSINNHSIKASSLVSKDWLNKVTGIIEENNTNEIKKVVVPVGVFPATEENDNESSEE